jgi:hypothetical protein
MRNTLALAAAVIINKILIHMLNNYMEKNMYITTGFSEFRITLTAGVWVISIYLMLYCFGRQWRRIDEK